VEAFDESTVTDSAWSEFEKNGDGKALAAKHALFFRSVFAPALAVALTRVRVGDVEALGAFGDRPESGLRSRLESQPAPMHSFVHTIVLAKGCSSWFLNRAATAKVDETRGIEPRGGNVLSAGGLLVR
jgi:hypothetical protein